MKNEFEKKEYCRPEMEVVALSYQSNLLEDSGYDESTAQFHSPADIRIG